MSEDTTPKPTEGESTGRQDGGAGMFAGIGGVPFYASPATLVYGTTLSGYAAGCASPFYGPLAAVVGVGTLEGTNKYAPLMGGSVGLAGFGGLPGSAAPWPGTYANYRIMSSHPALVLAGVAAMMPVLGSRWSYTAKDDAPGDAQQFIQDTMEPIRASLVLGCLRSLVFGWQSFERIYGTKDGRVTLVRLKQLLPEMTTVRVDEHGHFAGLVNGTVTLPPEKCFVYTYDQEGDNYYGRSRHENVRRAWSNWLNTEDNLARLGAKTSSIIPRIGYPPAEGVDQDGTAKSNYEIATKLGQGMASGRPVVFPNLSTLEIDDIKHMPDMAKASMWSIDTLDMGNPGPAIDSLTALLNYYDKMLVRGWLCAERSLLEAQKGGSRADSDGHTDIYMMAAAALANDIAAKVSETIVDDLLAMNYGEAARGSVVVEAQPLVDEDKEVDNLILTGITSNLPALAKLLSQMDMPAWLDRVGVPTHEKIDEEAFADVMPAPPPTAAPGKTPGKPAATNLSLAVDDSPLMRAMFPEAYGDTMDLSAIGATHKFASTQIDIPEPHAARLLEFIRQIPDDEIDEKDGREENPHVTVKYGLHSDDADDVAKAIDGTSAPEMRLGKLSVFPATADRPSDVLKVSVHSPALHRLNRKIARAIPHTDTHPKYTPHLTLAYLKPGEGAKYEGDSTFDGLGIRADKLIHSARDGTRVELPFAETPLLSLSATDDGDGRWVTMEGEHVFIKGGKIEKGPANLVGKKPSDLPGREKVGEHESSYHAAMNKHSAKEYRSPTPSDLEKEHIFLWHGTTLGAAKKILASRIQTGQRGINASADVAHADQYPEDTGAEALVLIKAKTGGLTIDPNDQNGETVSDGLFPRGTKSSEHFPWAHGSSASVGEHEVVSAFHVVGAKEGYREALQRGDWAAAKKLGVRQIK